MKKAGFFILAFFCILSLVQESVFATELLKKVSGPAFILDLRYNSDQNFLKKNVYQEFGLEACYVHPDLWVALQKIEKVLAEKKLKLIFWDCWRPASVQKAMWKLKPDARYVADPGKGSNHNRGIALDVTLADESGKPLAMPTPFDDFSPQAAAKAACPSQELLKCKNRDLLILIMEQAGLKPNPDEWWHFQLPGQYPLIPHFPKT